MRLVHKSDADFIPTPKKAHLFPLSGNNLKRFESSPVLPFAASVSDFSFVFPRVLRGSEALFYFTEKS